MAAHSAEPFEPFQRGRTARGYTRLQSKKSMLCGAEAPAPRNPKGSIHRVQKTGSCKAKGPKAATACENCRSVMRFHHLNGLQLC